MNDCCFLNECMIECIHDWITGKDLIGPYNGFLQIVKKNN